MGDDREYHEDDRRSELTALFEAFDDGKLTAENANSFELDKPTAKTERDGGASGADQGGQAAQHKGDAVKPPATGGEQQQTSRDRTRDDLGRFAKGAEDASGQKKPQDAGATPAKPDQATQQQQAQQPADKPATEQATPAPEGLSARASQLWGTATPELRQYMQETEGTLAKLAEPMRDVFTAAKEIGVPWPQFLGNVMSYERSLRNDPMGTMIHMARNLGVDLDELADMAIATRGGQGGGAPAQQQQQQPNEINRVLQPFQQRIAQLETKLTSREQAEQEAQHRQRQTQVDAIKREMQSFSQSGNAPHWASVQGELMGHMRAVVAENPNASTAELIKSAYDRAVWANPATRAKVLAEQQRSERSRQLEDATSHRGGPTRQPMNGSENLTLRSEIERNWDAVHSR
jgi:hypothetical protein